jgi:FRG domain-containing protein
MHTEPISSWSKLLAFFEKQPAEDIAYRGQDKKYASVKAKLDRCLEQRPTLQEKLRMERAVCQRFREHAPIYLSDVERSLLQTRWLGLVVMQHYGAPTRLLDWSKSAAIAAYFAVSNEYNNDGYILGFSRKKLQTFLAKNKKSELKGIKWGAHPSHDRFSDEKWDLAIGNEKLMYEDEVSKLSNWVSTYYCRQAHFPRLVAQQGIFTFASRPDLDHWQQIKMMIPDGCFKVTIKSDQKLEILGRLANLGVNGETLFPGPDGVGRYTEAFARTWRRGAGAL